MASYCASEDAVTATHTYMHETREARVFDRTLWIVDSRSARSASPFRLMSAPPLSTCWGPKSEAAPGCMNGDAR